MRINQKINQPYRRHYNPIVIVLQRISPISGITNGVVTNFSISDIFGRQANTIAEIEHPKSRATPKRVNSPNHGTGRTASKYNLMPARPQPKQTQQSIGSGIIIEPRPQMPSLISSIEEDDISLVDGLKICHPLRRGDVAVASEIIAVD